MKSNYDLVKKKVIEEEHLLSTYVPGSVLAFSNEVT